MSECSSEIRAQRLEDKLHSLASMLEWIPAEEAEDGTNEVCPVCGGRRYAGSEHKTGCLIAEVLRRKTYGPSIAKRGQVMKEADTLEWAKRLTEEWLKAMNLPKRPEET